MSNIVDDLLQEVEQLEQSTQQMNDNAQNVEKQKAQLKGAQSTPIDAELIALETAKTAQEASLQSHLAAKAALKMADQLKSQGLELEEFNYNWRQSIRNNSKELQSAKSSFTMMMASSMVINIIALGVIGYFFYETNKQNAQFKGETLDIIQTESNLLNKKITLKVDELASLIEALSGDITRMKNSFSTPVKIHSAVDDNANETPPETLMDEHASAPKVEQKAEAHIETQDTKPETNHSVMHPAAATAIESASGAHHDDIATSVHNQPTADETKHKIQTPAMMNHSTTEQSVIDYSEIKALIEKILAEQHKLQATTLAGSTTASLDDTQVKKLNDITWLVRKQEKVLKAIQTNLKNETSASPADSSTSKAINNTLNELKKQLDLLTEQQLTIQNQVKNLQADLTKYASKPEPYSYKLK